MKKINPVGNKLLVKKLSDRTDRSGMIFASGMSGNVPMEIVELPNPITNPWIKEMSVGDIVICKDFDADRIVDPDTDEQFYIVDVEAPESYRAGQVLAVIKK